MTRSSKIRTMVCLVATCGVATYGWIWSMSEQHTEAASVPTRNGGSDESVRVETITPRKGGLARTTVQPGSVNAFEEADLYSQAYGYLKELKVDIGSKVKKGDVLAKIDVPEIEEAILERKAAVDQSQANVLQMKAKVEVATADHAASIAAVDRQLAAQKRDEARLSFHEKQFKRVQSLLELKSIDERLVDEKEDQYLASLAALDSTKASVVSAKLDVQSAKARIGQANADEAAAEAAVRVAESALAKAEVRRKFSDILSPYDGVITVRNFHVGDFIRDAQNGGSIPLLKVERTDVMRVVIQIPDREVSFTDVGDAAEVYIDALPNRVFKGKVSRFANSEDHATRTMRTEVDIVNKDGLLRNGMYGKVTIFLQEPGEGWTVPSTAIVGKVEDGQGEIYVVQDGKAHRRKVSVGADNGTEIEILTGLTADSQVVIRYNGAIGDKVPVRVTPPRS